MIDVRPFRALHYEPKVAGAAADVIAPPYDVIDDAARDRLYDRHPHNAVRLILNRDPDRYSASAEVLRQWLAAGVLVRAAEPAIYYLVQNFRLPDGRAVERSGLLGALRLEAFSTGHIRPHERTFARAKEDRMRLLRACRVNFSPIFGMYAGHGEALAPARERTRSAPWLDVTDDRQERHRVWRIAEPDAVATICEGLRGASVLIADGHHRYETALAYRDERIAAGDDDPDAGHRFLLFYLACMDDPGLVILPTHRVVHRFPIDADEFLARCAAAFDVRPTATPAEAAARVQGASDGSIGWLHGGRGYVLVPRPCEAAAQALADLTPAVRSLDVALLDAFVLRTLLGIDPTAAAQEGWLGYTHDDKAAVAAGEQAGQAVFLLRAPSVHDVERVCLAGETMPEKSTYFYPKLPTGLVFRPLD